MQKLGGGYGFTKIDLADAYNQIPLSPESQKRLAPSTHRGVILPMRLPPRSPGYQPGILPHPCDSVNFRPQRCGSIPG